MSSKDAAAEMLAKTELFGALSEADLATVVGEMREANFSSGQVIFARGDEGRDIYLVVKGRVRLSVLTAEGRELSFAHAEAGQIFGEIAVLDGGERTADATTVTKMTALTLSKAALQRLIESNIGLREGVIRFLCNRLREADQQLEGIALYPIEIRLARFFLASARQKEGPDVEGKVPLSLPISQSELALLIGASRPKVNAALALLESSGAIERGEGGIFTCDIDQLEDMTV
ncbi:MAG: Crp/Fnr family transcriptional regulator [Alphaproteobacteria bacterium]|nr:Crp/Fnr family transcriptional regulator [Alphaproteobacteria bacterium]